MSKKFTKKILFTLVFSSWAFFSQAQVIAAWDFNTAVGNETTVAATTLDANLNPTSVSRGPGLNASALGNAFAATDYTLNGTLVNATTNGDYMQFTINCKVGYTVSLSTLDANFRRSSSGPDNFQWQYSLDGFTTAGVNVGSNIVYSSTATNGFPQTQISLGGISALQGVGSSTTITFRLYGYNASATTGTFALGRITGNDLSIGGTVTPIVTPISINYFTGAKHNQTNDLLWKVACNSTPSVTLTIERSTNGRNFNAIYSLDATAARCDQPFNYTDLQPLSGLNYYRLKMTTIDGKISYSTIVALLSAEKGLQIVNVSPNPIPADGNFKLNISAAQDTRMDIIIADMQGHQVSKQTISIVNGYNSIPVNLNKLASGNYTIYGVANGIKTQAVSFIK